MLHPSLNAPRRTDHRWLRSLLADTPQATRATVLLLYMLVGPSFIALILVLGGLNAVPAALTCAALIAVGAVVMMARRTLTDTSWIVPGALVPTLCCVIGADSLFPLGGVFLAVAGAPVAWSAMLFGPRTALAAMLVAALGTGLVLGHNGGLGLGLASVPLLMLIHGLVVFVVRGKSGALRRARREIDEALSRQAALVASLPDTVARLDREGRFLWVSAGQEPLVLPPEQFVGRLVTEFVPVEVADEVRMKLAQTFTVPGVQRMEYTARYPDGQRVFELRATRASEHEIIVVRRDLTRLRELDARLQQSENLASLGTLAAGVAHEINNPLAFVSSNVEFAIERLRERPDAPATDETLTALAEAHDGAIRIRDIVRGLQMFSRTGASPPSRTDLNDVARTGVMLLQNQVESRGRLEVELGEVPLVAGDRTRLGQIVVNLVSNAAKALDPARGERNVVAVRTFVRTGAAVLEVRDNGAGMAPEILQQIFVPFFTTRRIGEGVGLGLSISLGIARSLGGNIEVESRVGTGSVFRLVVPLAEATAVSPPAATPAPRVATAAPCPR